MYTGSGFLLYLKPIKLSYYRDRVERNHPLPTMETCGELNIYSILSTISIVLNEDAICTGSRIDS